MHKLSTCISAVANLHPFLISVFKVWSWSKQVPVYSEVELFSQVTKVLFIVICSYNLNMVIT